MKGKCLCDQVQFEVTGNISNLYECHCTLCQKATGTSSCSAIVVGASDVRWIKGRELISSFIRENGFRTDFCSRCGSPVPNKMNLGDYMWIPAGLLEGPLDKQIVAKIHLNSKASWERYSQNCKNYGEGPGNIDEFIQMLHGKQI